MRSFRKPVLALLLLILTIPCGGVYAQSRNKIQEIVVEGTRQASPALVVIQSGLQVGNSLSADNTSEAVRKLWNLGIFSDIRVIREDTESGVKVTIRVTELPVVNSISRRVSPVSGHA